MKTIPHLGLPMRIQQLSVLLTSQWRRWPANAGKAVLERLNMPTTYVVCASIWCCVSASAKTLEVGPGKHFQRIEDANAAAEPGDVVIVYPLPGDQAYAKTAVFVACKNVAFRGVLGPNNTRIKISGKGYDYSGAGKLPRAIFQFNRGADGCSLDGFDLSEAHNQSHNGAGVRINQANDVTISNCEIHHNDMGIMSNGDGSLNCGANQLIERCIIHHNGNKDDPGQNHNLYLGGASVTLLACEVHSSLTGHNVKSRAHLTTVLACYVHDSNNREFDLVDAKETTLPGSDALLAGSVVIKDTACTGNRAVIHFGQDGGNPHNGTITLVNNTIMTPFVSPVVDLSEAGTHARLVNNLISDGGSGKQRMVLVEARRGGANLENAIGTHNGLSASFAPLSPKFSDESNVLISGPLPFRDPKRCDFHLAMKSAKLVGVGLPWNTLGIAYVALRTRKFALDWEYQASASAVPRKDGGTTLGAFAWAD